MLYIFFTFLELNIQHHTNNFFFFQFLYIYLKIIGPLKKNLYNHTKKAISREMSVKDFVMRLTLVIKMG